MTVDKVDIAQHGTHFRVKYTAISSHGTKMEWYSNIADHDPSSSIKGIPGDGNKRENDSSLAGKEHNECYLPRVRADICAVQRRPAVLQLGLPGKGTGAVQGTAGGREREKEKRGKGSGNGRCTGGTFGDELRKISRDAGHKRRINPCKNHLTFCAKLLKSRCSIDSRSTLQHSQTAIRQTF